MGPDGEKMSKSKGNVVDPNDVVDEFGADVLRVYTLFMGDYSSAAPWNESSVKGVKRFIDRTAALTDIVKGRGVTPALESAFHKTVKKVSLDIEAMKFNTAIAQLMTLINTIYDAGSLTKDELEIFVKLLSPFAPHICEEIYASLGNDGFVSMASWPQWDEAKTVDSSVEYAVQIMGKLRGTVMAPADAERDEVLSLVKADGKIAPFLDGKQIVKEIFVPKKLVNLVVK